MIGWQPRHHAQWAALFWQPPKMSLGWQIAINLSLFIQSLAPFEVPILLCTDPESLFWHTHTGVCGCKRGNNGSFLCAVTLPWQSQAGPRLVRPDRLDKRLHLDTRLGVSLLQFNKYFSALSRKLNLYRKLIRFVSPPLVTLNSIKVRPTPSVIGS